MTIYLFQYNNYYNRQVKGFDDIADYPDPVGTYYQMQFNPNDGLNTSIVLNTDIAEHVDYLIVCNDDNTINSRWFIMEAKRLRQGQYQFSLNRDLVYDYREQVLSAPCFIEKATLDANNPLIFNSENFSVNQIKTKEYLLKDSFALPWVVAYIKKEATKTITIPAPAAKVDITVDTIDQYEWYDIAKDLKAVIRSTKFYLNIWSSKPLQEGATLDNTLIMAWDKDGEPVDPGIGQTTDYLPYGSRQITSDLVNFDKGFNYTASPSEADVVLAFQEQCNRMSWEVIDPADYIFDTDPGYISNVDDIWEEEGKIIFEESTGKYYKVKVKNLGVGSKFVEVGQGSSLGRMYTETAKKVSNISTSENTTEPPIGYISADFSKYELVFEAFSNDALSISIDSGRLNTALCPYDIIAIPVGNYEVYLREDGAYVERGQYTSEETAFKLAAAITEKFSEDLLDIQLLPYAPIKDYIYGSRRIVFHANEPSRYSLLQKNGSNDIYGVVFYVQEEDFTCKLFTDRENPYYDPASGWKIVEEFEIPAAKTAVDLKIQNECKSYRIVSPNYASVFEINPAKNNGLKGLRADCTYKPFSPYIKVYPEFSGLYGQNFNDNRGMIISGDFSLPRTQDAWENYQLQNKNYLNIFDRQIDNLEFNNRLAMQEAVLGAGVGALGAGVQTGVTTGMAAGPYAGAAAGLGAAAVSGGAGIVDISILAKRQAETLDYTKDMFGMQLGNIKARHDTVAKISAFDINSKTWPFVEVYECTDLEEQAFKDKLKWNGMTVGVIGTIEQYLKNNEQYIKGKLIRLSDIALDYHLAVELAAELNKGVFI